MNNRTNKPNDSNNKKTGISTRTMGEKNNCFIIEAINYDLKWRLETWWPMELGETNAHILARTEVEAIIPDTEI